MKKVNVIHLSDIHFNNSNEINDLINKLISDLLEIKEELNDFHLLIITGDCVDKGQVNLFEIFSKKLDKLLKECGISKKKVAIAIGNHDVNLNSNYLEMLKKSNLNNNSNENLLVKLEPDITSIYQEYNKFVKNYINTENGINVSDITVKGLKKSKLLTIRLIMLNSSWSTTIHNKYGELKIGDTQLKNIREKIDSLREKKKKCDYVFLCMHHPLDWFTFQDRNKIRELMEYANVDFFLHGHIHTSDVKNVNNIDATINTLCTGISYKKEGEKSSSKSGMRYSIYQIDKYTKTMNIYIRSTNEKGKFVPDTTLYSNVKQGFFTIPLENIRECLMPFNSVDQISRYSIVLTNDNVKKILSKESLLFDFYCAMSQKIENICNEKEDEYLKYKRKWIENKAEENEVECRKDFEKEQFGLFCYDMLIHLNALFFHGNVRFLIRVYRLKTNSHDVFVADGVESSQINNIKNFNWKEGLIYYSYIKNCALLQSTNPKYYKKGNSDIWKNSLTIAIKDVTILVYDEPIPALTMNIAINSLENEPCLEALALSSIYQKIGKIFALYIRKVYNIKNLIMEDYI